MPQPHSSQTADQHVVLVSGPSGAGRSTAINALEDVGYETIDNIPLTLIPRLIDGGAPDLPRQPLALGIDVRNRDFSAQRLLDLHRDLGARSRVRCDLLYLDCTAEVLIRRYSETRRRHPLARDEDPAAGIARELALLEDVRARADIVLESSDLTVHDLRAEIDKWFGHRTGQGMAVSLHSFSYKRGLPQGLDMVLDCRFLRNPHWDRDLRPFTGLDARVADYVGQDPRFDSFVSGVETLLGCVLPGCVAEGKSHFQIGFGCTGGQHRSVTLTERIAAGLAHGGWQVSIRHRELERRGMVGKSAPVTQPQARMDGKAEK